VSWGGRYKLVWAAVAAAFFATSMSTTTRALADATSACTTAAEDGQRARASGKLRAARSSFLSCSGAGGQQCPSVVQRDCAKWAAELADATPTIVLDARDTQGHDVGDARVTIDGEVVRNALDGKAIEVDPGSHVILLERPNGARGSETIIAKEGVKARVVRVAFGDASPMQPASANRNEQTAKGGDDPQQAPTAGTTGGHTVWPWIVVGVGGVSMVTGLLLILTAPDLPPGCDTSTSLCTPFGKDASGRDIETQEELSKRQQQAGTATDQPTWGTVVLIGGTLIALGGVAWHFLEPTGPSKGSGRQRKPHVAPWIGSGGGGLAASGTF
jgi:hypothetical protein